MKAAAREPAYQPLRPPPEGVVIRMYRPGLGDCFLLVFAGSGERPVYVLIDCGVHRTQPDGNPNLRRIVADITAATGGHIDVLIATHAQEEHVSGFVLVEQEFAKSRLTIEQLWLAWTEDADDALASALQATRLEAWQALDTARRHLHMAGRAAGLDGNELALYERLDDACSSDSLSALSLLRKYARRVRYLRPSKSALRIPGAKAARAYVLGPPYDPAHAAASQPTSDSHPDTFLTHSAGLTSFAAAIQTRRAPAAAPGAAGTSDADRLDEQTREQLCQPFSATCRIELARAARDPYFRRFFGLDDSNASAAWRGIEHEWLGAAGQLALDSGRHANNASLALAFEIGPRGSGRVLLFPGDAQVGSWLSWPDLRWGKPPRATTAADLLLRTVVYKVGDHGSPTATLQRDAQQRSFGLPLMPAGLVAMLPVDEAVARRLPGGSMPDPYVREALQSKAGQTLLRSDDTDPRAAVLPHKWQSIPGLAKARWRQSAARKADGQHPLFYDLLLAPLS